MAVIGKRPLIRGGCYKRFYCNKFLTKIAVVLKRLATDYAAFISRAYLNYGEEIV